MSNAAKVACHVHSDWSYDGKWSLPDLAAAFSERGYRVVMMTEHDQGFSEARRVEHQQACAAASSERLLVVPGIEYSDNTNTVHILVWGAVPFLGEGIPTAKLLGLVKAAGGVAVLAHPSRRAAWKVFNPSWVGGLLGIEAWNRKTDGWAPSRTAGQLLAGTALKEFVGLDFHDKNQFFPLAMEVELEEPISEVSTLDSLKSGRFQATAFGSNLSRIQAGGKGTGLRLAESGRRSLAALKRYACRGLPRRTGRALSAVKQHVKSPSDSVR